MNWESILTGVVTGVLTGVIASAITGYFGVLYAFKQLRAQRAFDRQLEWYERTIRALGRFSTIHRELLLLPQIKNPQFNLMKEAQEAVVELEKCLSEAVLYAEQQSYEQLNATVIRWQEIVLKSEGKMDHVDAATVAFQETLVELSKPLREKLGLKKVEL
jgi:hypothetical protein